MVHYSWHHRKIRVNTATLLRKTSPLIRDLETLLLSVSDSESRAYLHEAVKCYNAGAYRAAVVLSIASGMDGLRKRLEELTTSGGGSAEILIAHKQVDGNFRNQVPYEAELIDLCENTISMLTPSEADKMRLMLKLRHLCAHPSGHAGTPEEARDAIATVVDLILSRPARIGLNSVTSIIDRLNGPNFFPHIKDYNSNKTTVQSETRYLYAGLYNALATKIVSQISLLAAQVADDSGAADVDEARRNFTTFLAHFTKINLETQKAVWKYINRIIEEPATTQDALLLLSHDAQGLHLAEPLVRERAIGLIRRNLTSKDARNAARILRTHSLISEVEIDEIIRATSKAFLDGEAMKVPSVEQVLDLGWPEVEASFFDKVIERCENHFFADANPAILVMQSLTPAQASRVTPTQQLKYILTIAENASRSNSANEAKAVAEKGLGKRVDFLNALADALENKQDTLLDENIIWEYVARICESSSRSDIIPALIDLFDDPTKTSTNGINMLGYLRLNRDPKIGGRARDVYTQMATAIYDEAIANQ